MPKSAGAVKRSRLVTNKIGWNIGLPTNLFPLRRNTMPALMTNQNLMKTSGHHLTTNNTCGLAWAVFAALI